MMTRSAGTTVAAARRIDSLTRSRFDNETPPGGGTERCTANVSESTTGHDERPVPSTRDCRSRLRLRRIRSGALRHRQPDALGEHLLDHPEQRLACDLVDGLRAVDQRLDF